MGYLNVPLSALAVRDPLAFRHGEVQLCKATQNIVNGGGYQYKAFQFCFSNFCEPIQVFTNKLKCQENRSSLALEMELADVMVCGSSGKTTN